MQRTSLRPLQSLFTNRTFSRPLSATVPATSNRFLHNTISRPASLPTPATADMTTANFKYIDPTSYDPSATAPFKKAWNKVDGPGYSFKLSDHTRDVENIRGRESSFSTDTSGFAIHTHPSVEKTFTDDAAVRGAYYDEVISLLKQKLSSTAPGGSKVKKVVLFDHTIRRRQKNSPRQPVQQVHVDQTPGAAETRVRRHITDPQEAEELLKGRYQIINVWRPIENAATDFPLAVIDYRSTAPEDFVKVDLLYPKRQDSPTTSSTTTPEDDDDDDRGKERLPDPESFTDTAGYEVKGETFAVAPSPAHKFYYVRDMRPDEVMFIKCFDSRSEWFAGAERGRGAGHKGRAHCTPHTAFVDPLTPADAPGRQSIEVRALVFYED